MLQGGENLTALANEYEEKNAEFCKKEAQLLDEIMEKEERP